MKSYDITQPTQQDNDIVAAHKAARDKVIGKSSKSMETESDTFSDTFEDDIFEDTDLDDINDDDGIEDNNDIKDSNIIKDSAGNEAKIENPMWKTNEKRNQKLDKKKSKNKSDGPLDTTPSWQKPPSRMSTSSWLVTLSILLIPGLNIIMLPIWAFFSDSVAEEKRNFCRASICIVTIMLTASIIFGVAIGGFKVPTDEIKNKASDITEDFKDYTDDALRNEAGSAQDNYNRLTDDDFTN